MKNLVVFHKGRGGRFNNQGYLTCKCLTDSFDADAFGINIYFTFENEGRDDLQEVIEILETHNIYFSDLVEKTNEEINEIFRRLKLENVEAVDLGDRIVVDESRNFVANYEDYYSENGSLDLDGDYDFYYWKPISEITEEELEVIERDLNSYEVEEVKKLI